MILVIGIGNPLRGDDGFGWSAGRRFSCGAPQDASVRVIDCHQLTPELAEPLSTAEAAFFLDARADGTPGAVKWEWLTPRQDSGETFTHRLTPAALLGSARSLYGAAPSACLVTVTGQQFDFGEGLSPVVQNALERVIDRLLNLIRSGKEYGTMHELGLADAILTKTLEISRANGAKPVERVLVRVGRLKLVVPETLTFAFDALKENTLASDAVLEIEEEDARIICRKCEAVFTPVDVFWVCPSCGATGGKVVAGDELTLRSVILRDECSTVGAGPGDSTTGE